MNRLGIQVVPGSTGIAELTAFARDCESRELAALWLGEAWREPVVPMAALALATEELELGTSIAQVFPLNPVVAAQQAAQLQELAGGRFRYGLGLGAAFVVERWFGVSYERPLRRMREFVEILRGALRSPEDGPFSYEGEILRTRRYTLSFAERAVEVPVNIAALGPKMQELAGEIADGIVLGGLHSAGYVEETRERLRAGAERADRDPGEVALYYSLACCVADDPERAAEHARHTLSYMAQYPHYQRIYEREGYGPVVAEIGALVREKEMGRAAALIDDAMIERFCLAGTVEECRQQLARFDYGDANAILFLVPFRTDEAEVMAALRLAAQIAPLKKSKAESKFSSAEAGS